MTTRVAERGVVRVTGADAATYLQGQISQDVDAIGVGSSAWSMILDPTGKLVAWFRLHRLDEGFVIDCEPESVEPLIARLMRFRLRTDVEFTAEEGWVVESTLDGSLNGDLSALLEWPGFTAAERLAQDARAAVEDDDYELARIRAALPRMGVDIDDETIPAEGGQPLIDLSVSFTKGCYTGQELVARIDSRGGNVPRPLRVIEATAPLTVGAAVEFEGQEIGTLTSAADSVGLARILRKADVGAAVTVGGVAATVISPTG